MQREMDVSSVFDGLFLIAWTWTRIFRFQNSLSFPPLKTNICTSALAEEDGKRSNRIMRCLGWYFFVFINMAVVLKLQEERIFCVRQAPPRSAGNVYESKPARRLCENNKLTSQAKGMVQEVNKKKREDAPLFIICRNVILHFSSTRRNRILRNYLPG